MRVEILYKNNSIKWMDCSVADAYQAIKARAHDANVVKVSLMDDRTVLLYCDKREKA